MSKVDYEIRKLQKRVTNGGMDRREFIKAATAMGFAATAPALYSHAAYARRKKAASTAWVLAAPTLATCSTRAKTATRS